MRLLSLFIAVAVAAPALAADEAKPADPKDPLVCKRETPIGSLIATRKICLTKSQWRKRIDDGNSQARRLVEDGAGRCGANGGDCGMGK